MPEHDPHSSPIKTPKQLIIVVLLAFLIPIVVIALLSQLFTSTRHDASGDEQRVLERIKPVGTVVIAEASGPKGNLTGEQVYGQICKTCHEAGIAGAPKAGDKAAWAPRVAQGEKTMVQHAIAGFQGKTGVMPPKGGNMDLTDDEVHRAVVYLANQVGGGAKADGKAVYDKTCSVCHATGLAGAPKFGDKAAWAPRIATGIPTLHNAALKGLNAMPPRGGNMALSDAEVTAAADYMVGAAK